MLLTTKCVAGRAGAEDLISMLELPQSDFQDLFWNTGRFRSCRHNEEREYNF